MRLLHISDTHNLHKDLNNLPPADIIVHSGDISYAGTGKEVAEFIEWFGALDFCYKIFIGGNHDFSLEGKSSKMIQQFLPDNCFYLCNSGITIHGIKFWGIPFFFADDLSGDYYNMINQIPADTDILISHNPPFGILDHANGINFGCSDLLHKVSNIRPLYHLFGHIHDSYGINESEQTIFANASLLDEDYRLVNDALVFDI